MEVFIKCPFKETDVAERWGSNFNPFLTRFFKTDDTTTLLNKKLDLASSPSIFLNFANLYLQMFFIRILKAFKVYQLNKDQKSYHVNPKN